MIHYYARPETKGKLRGNNIVINTLDKRTYWTETPLNDLIDKMAPGDMLEVYEGLDLACSTMQVLDILSFIPASSFVSFKKYDITFSDTINSNILIRLISLIERDFVSKRTTEALARRKQKGLPLGRPVGRQNKSLKLDKFREEIEKYMNLGISKASIAKLVSCHPQTLYDWLDRSALRGGV